jgi:hypothetical protein
MHRTYMQTGALLLSVLTTVLGYAQEQPVVVRLRDAVGDTIDRAERDSFHLFPNTAKFDKAVILALSGPEFFARITRAGPDSAGDIFLRIAPYDLERIRLLIDNRERVLAREQSDTGYARDLSSFWHTIEAAPLRNMAGEPAIEPEPLPPPPEPAPATGPEIAQETSAAPVTETPPAEPTLAEEIPAPPVEPVPAEKTAEAPPEEVAKGAPPLPPVTSESRYSYMLHGATSGALVGTLLGYSTGVGIAAPCLFVAGGSTAGYALGEKLDRQAIVAPHLQRESQTWRMCCGLGAVVPGVLLGVATAQLLGSAASHEDESFWMAATLSGVCVGVEIVTLGYRLGRSLDREGAY